MELFIFSKKLPLIERFKLATPLFHGALTVLFGGNWSLKFKPATKAQANGLSADIHQVELPAQKTLIVIADRNRRMLDD
ncbi:hypothetical protein [Rahnella aceris]|uniref:hypothetical protein n=1 Tax=Rahnella sp. (strain Y9602) TaxID=2703885 RepID=UPI003648D83A